MNQTAVSGAKCASNAHETVDDGGLIKGRTPAPLLAFIEGVKYGRQHP
jgi:hypothetical protein